MSGQIAEDLRMSHIETFYEVMRRQGITRRSFMKYCSLTAAALGLRGLRPGRSQRGAGAAGGGRGGGRKGHQGLWRGAVALRDPARVRHPRGAAQGGWITRRVRVRV